MIDLNPLFGYRKPIVLIFLVCCAAFMMASSLFMAPAKAQVLIGTEAQITTDPAEQTDPAISGNYIVYTDSRNGQQDIYLYNTITGEETDLTLGWPNNQYLDDIDGNNVVFTNVATGSIDIYLYDIATALFLPLTDRGENYSPSIDGDLVAWFTRWGAGYDIVLADLKTRTSTILTNEAPSVSRPRVDNGIVVWAELMGTRTQIRSYNYASGELRTITTDSASHADPDVSDNKVVWASNEAGNWDIYVYDLISGVTTQLTYNTADQIYPRINGNNVVWEDTRSGTHQIWFMNLDEGLEMPVYPTGHTQFLNAIDDNHIVWTESRYGNLDIFMFTFELPGPSDTTPPTTTISLSGTLGTQNWYTSDVTVTLSATDDLSGVATTHISLDNGATWQEYTTPVAITNDGLNHIKYYSVDNRGNTETTRYTLVMIDKTAPTLTILEPISRDYHNSETITVVVSVEDEVSGLWKVSADLDGTWVPLNQQIDLSPFSLGSHTLTVTATDNAGWTTTRRVTFNIIAITSPPVGGKWISTDKLELLNPLITSVSASISTAAIFVHVRRKRKQD